MRMDQLHYLLEIDKYRSISAAAQELYLGQTALSSIVNNMEEELGFDVFVRTHNGVRLTPEGEAALPLIWELSTRFDQLKELGSQTTAAAPVSVILSPTVNAALALPLNKLFLEREPGGNIDFHIVPGEDVGAQIIKNNSSIGVTYFSESELELFRAIAAKYQVEVEILLWDSLYLVVRKDHALAQRDSIPLDQVENERFALLPYYSANEGSLAYIKHFGPGNCFTTLPTVALVKRAVREQNMVAILSGYASQYGGGEEERCKLIRPENTVYRNRMPLCLIRRSDSSIRYHEKAIIRCIQDHFREVRASGLIPQED